jgi:hypothetical protein
MFGRSKKSKISVQKKMSPKKSSEPAQQKTAFQKILTAEGWRRMMLKKKKK